MDASKVGLGALMLGASGITLELTGVPGASVPLGLAGLAAVGLAVAAVADRSDRRTVR